jgi:hypothetical protein
MKTWLKVLIVTVLVAVPAFLLEPNSPLGVFWDPHPETAEPTGIQVPLFMLLGLINALMLGLGVSFLLFGYPLVSAIGCASRGLARAAHLAIGWILVSWWLHDSLHMVAGMELGALLGIEYGFHVTVMIAGLVVAYFFIDALRGSEAASATC